MAEQFLDRADVVARLEQVRRERVAQRVRVAGLAIPESRSADFIARWNAWSER